MSMPKFPEIDPDITCDNAINMILISIAMEELALSHIINAEGEKLQYVLGTLETSNGSKPDVDEVLKVNQSVTCLMDSVLQNQMILKNKMDKALNALSNVCSKPSGSSKHDCKCSAVFKAMEKCKQWCSGSALNWNTEHLHGKCVCYNPCDKTKIGLHSKGRFMVNFAVNVRAKGCKCNAAISLHMIKDHQCTDIYTVHSRVPCDNTIVAVSMSGIIIEISDYHEHSFILFKLVSPDSLMVEDSMLSIMEI